ncbi:MAG TPA: hypothetical protein VGJ25_04660 [Gaiellaceae bacterium]|jgi:hypothetical protein
MLCRLAPLAPMLAAAGADGAGAHRLAFYLLLLAIPAAAAAGLERFAAALDGHGETRQAIVCGMALALVVLSEAARGPRLAENAAPALAISALAVSLVLLVLQILRGLVTVPLPTARRPV